MGERNEEYVPSARAMRERTSEMRASDVGLVRGACGGLVAAHTFASLVGVVSCVCVNRTGVCLCVSGLSVCRCAKA